MRKLFVLLSLPLFLLLGVGAIMAKPPLAPMSIRAPLLIFENLEQYYDNAENWLVVGLGRIDCPAGQSVVSGNLSVLMDYVRAERVVLYAENMGSDYGKLENLRMEWDPKKGWVIRADGGWMENVSSPSYLVVLGTLYYENLRVVMA